MSQSAIKSEQQETEEMLQNKRKIDQIPPLLTLVELDPTLVIEGKRVADGLLAEDLTTFGGMREVCPACESVNLQLVLRQKQVKLAHLFCPKCTRCYDARYPDGSCALSLV